MYLLPGNVAALDEDAPVETSWLPAEAASTSPASQAPRFSPEIEAAAHAIRDRWRRRPRLGLVLGTGLGHLASLVEAEAVIPYAAIPHFPHCTALAHEGRFIAGLLAGVPIVVMQGRCHLYEGHSLAQVALPTYVMRALGAETLLLTNAAGAVNPRFAVGDVMVIEDHINLMFAGPMRSGCPRRSDLDGATESPGRAVFSHPCYDPLLLRRAQLLARRENLPLQTGVYVGVTGPNYETRAEYRCFRKLGGDAVGMSTVPEALAARFCGLRTLALSTITNVARPDAPQVVDMHDVVSVAERAEPIVRRIVSGVVESLR